jgi:formate dehydrogenase alpha subunit
LENIVLSIDGKTVSCPAETSILEAAEANGIKIPTLCYHPDLKPFGACRLCLVEDEKTGRLLASCVTPVAQGMVIQTASTRIMNHRRNIARLMIAEHPESCIVCNKGNRCQLRWVAAQLGVGETDLYHLPNYKALEQANPFIIRDLSKCILCGKCIRADHELVSVGAIDYNLRGFKSRPATAHETGLEKSSCTFCGTCVSMCPTGALSTKNNRYVGSPERESLSICGFCGVGCSLVMGATDNKIIEINPAHQPATVNKATLCVRGHFAHDFLNSSERLVTPLIQKEGDGEDEAAHLVPISWDEGLEFVARRLKEIKNENGSQSIAFMGSSKCSNEENYLLQKIARLLMGTNNIDNGGYVSGQFLLSLLDQKIDGGCRVNPLADLEKAEVILILGADPNHSLPVVSYHLKKAVKAGTSLIVVDPRKTELVNFSSVWLRLKPQTDLELINGLGTLLHEKNAYDAVFIDRYTEGFSILSYSLSSLDLKRVCRVTGLEKSLLDKTAEILKGKKIAFVIGHGILQQKYGIHSLGAILNLSLMTGSLGKKGAGIYVLARENNQVGAMDMGALPNFLPGREPLSEDAARKRWEKAWNVKISPDPGLNMSRIVQEAEKGTLKALYIMGENPLRSLPQPDRVKKALEKLDFLVMQDVLNNDIAKIAHVVLPGAAFCEKEGSFTNLEGRIQTFSPVIAPPGEAKADWEILDLLAVKLGYPEPYGSLNKIRTEIRKFIPIYAELDGQQHGWIKQTSRMAVFGATGGDGRILFYPVVATKEEKPDDEYPFTAIIGTLRYHLGSGTRTNASERIQDFGLKGEIEMSPQDAAQLNLNSGEPVNVLSRFGALKREVRLKSEIGAGQLFIPLAVNSNDAMNLIDLSDLADPNTAGWKTCAVKIEKI